MVLSARNYGVISNLPLGRSSSAITQAAYYPFQAWTHAGKLRFTRCQNIPSSTPGTLTQTCVWHPKETIRCTGRDRATHIQNDHAAPKQSCHTRSVRLRRDNTERIWSQKSESTEHWTIETIERLGHFFERATVGRWQAPAHNWHMPRLAHTPCFLWGFGN